MPRRRRKGLADDLLENEVSERAASVPALEPFLADDSRRPGSRIEVDGLEPGYSREPVTGLPAAFRIFEVGEQRIYRVFLEPEGPEPSASLVVGQRTVSGLRIVPARDAATDFASARID